MQDQAMIASDDIPSLVEKNMSICQVEMTPCDVDSGPMEHGPGIIELCGKNILTGK